MNTTNFGGGENYDRRLVFREPGFHGRTIKQVKLGATGGNDSRYETNCTSMMRVRSTVPKLRRNSKDVFFGSSTAGMCLPMHACGCSFVVFFQLFCTNDHCHRLRSLFSVFAPHRHHGYNRCKLRLRVKRIQCGGYHGTQPDVDGCST